MIHQHKVAWKSVKDLVADRLNEPDKTASRPSLRDPSLSPSYLDLDLLNMAPMQRVATCLFLALSSTVVRGQSSFLNVGPAATSMPATSPAGAPLQEAETLQLTDEVIERLASDSATAEYAEYFAFDDNSSANPASVRRAASASCKTFPGDAAWPKDVVWDVFNALLGGALIPTKPAVAPCYDSQWGQKDSAQCMDIANNFTNAYFHTDDPTSSKSLSCLVFISGIC